MTNLIEKKTIGIYPHLFFDNIPTLSEVVKAMGWGSNRDIREGKFRIAYYPEIGLWKNYPIIKDPYYKVQNTSMVGGSKGRSMCIIEIKRYE